MTEVILHIGYHRTGSTFLQEQVFPVLPVNHVLKPPARELLHAEVFDAQRFAAAVLDGCDPGRPTIVTHEIFSGAPEGGPPERRLRTARRLHEAFPAAKVLIVIRNQLDYVLSIYAYRVMIHGLECRDIATYLAAHFDELASSLQYDVLVGTYLDLFGTDRVLVLPFERLADPQWFVAQVTDLVGVQPPELTAKRVNESTRSRGVVAVNRVLNLPFDYTLGVLHRRRVITHRRYMQIARPWLRFKQRTLNPRLRDWIGRRGERLELPASFRDRITPTLQASNQRLARLTGLDLAALRYLT